MKKTLSKIIKVIVVIAILGGAYMFFVNRDTTPTQSLTVVPAGQTSAVRVSDIVFLLNELKGFEINTEVFSNPALNNLEDFRTTLPTESQGRPNPFLSLGER